jgi:hypothetical protein
MVPRGNSYAAAEITAPRGYRYAAATIKLGLRLTLRGGREAVVRLLLIGSAVAVGVGLLLTTLAGINAVNTQNARYAWINSASVAGPQQVATPSTSNATQASDPLWWVLRGDYFDSQAIGRLDVAATGPHSPVPPGIPRLPAPGEFYASPALTKLLDTTPPTELGDRFPGHEVGTIGPAALPAPNSLIIIIGHTPGELSHVPGAAQVTSIMTTAPSSCGNCQAGTNANGIDLVLSVVSCALLFPLLMFIGTATRLAATRREQRFAAMRLVGATPRQISAIATVESTVASAVGVAVGFALFFLLRGPVAGIPFTGAPFYASDLSLQLADVLGVAFGVPIAAALAARIALRRVRISPLGVTRRITPRPPRVYRMIPLLAGIGELAYFIGRRPTTTNGQVAAFLPGFLVVMVGLVVAGPWLTMVGSRVMARRSNRPATLIAARRLADNPQAGFRAVSGLMLALFVTSVAVGVITTVVAERGGHVGDAAATNLSRMWRNSGAGSTTSLPDALNTDLRSTPGVRSVVEVHANPDGEQDATVVRGTLNFGQRAGLVSCVDLERAMNLGRCAPGATVAEVWPDVLGPPAESGGTWHGLGTVWPSASHSVADLAQLPLLQTIVATDGSTAAIEQARTVMELAYPYGEQPPATDNDFRSDTRNTLTAWQQLANVIVLTSLPIAGCSLAVSIAGGLAERKRPFSLLRLTGAPLGVLRRVVALESAVPLLVVSVIAIGIGFLASELFLRAQLHYTLRPPGPAYYGIVGVGLVASLGIIASTLPLLRRITGPETARNE